MKVDLKIKNKNTIIFLVSIGISTFMWLLIKLSKDYEIAIDLPIAYAEMPENMLVNKAADSVLKIKLTDNGFDLLLIKITSPLKSLIIRNKDLRQKKLSDNRIKYYLLNYSLEDKLIEIFGKHSRISKIKPDSLVMILEELSRKKVIVKPDIEIHLAPQFQLSNPISITPDSVYIYGSQIEISQINEVYTEIQAFKKVNRAIESELKLVLPHRIVTKEKKISLSIEVEKYTEANLNIPIKVEFCLEKDIKIFPRHINIKYAVSLENYNKIKSDDFLVIGTQDSLVSGRLELKLTQQPNKIRILDYTPKMAEFILLK